MERVLACWLAEAVCLQSLIWLAVCWLGKHSMTTSCCLLQCGADVPEEEPEPEAGAQKCTKGGRTAAAGVLAAGQHVLSLAAMWLPGVKLLGLLQNSESSGCEALALWSASRWSHTADDKSFCLSATQHVHLAILSSTSRRSSWYASSSLTAVTWLLRHAGWPPGPRLQVMHGHTRNTGLLPQHKSPALSKVWRASTAHNIRRLASCEHNIARTQLLWPDIGMVQPSQQRHPCVKAQHRLSAGDACQQLLLPGCGCCVKGEAFDSYVCGWCT